MDKRVIVVIISVLLLLTTGFLIVHFILNKNKKTNSIVGTWDFYTLSNTSASYNGVSFEFKEDKSFKMTNANYGEETGTYEMFDKYLILKYKEEGKDDVYSMPYVFYLNDNKLCVQTTKCDEDNSVYFEKRSGDKAPDVTTTKNTSTTTKAQSLDSSEVTMYVFFGDGCPHCAELQQFIDSDSFFKNVKIVKFETWYDTNNQELLSKVANKLDVDVQGVPFIVIGDSYFEGYSSQMNDSIKNKISEYKNKKSKYTDIVYKYAKK